MKECKAISNACELQSQGQGWTDLNLFQGLQAPREASPVSSPKGSAPSCHCSELAVPGQLASC